VEKKGKNGYHQFGPLEFLYNEETNELTVGIYQGEEGGDFDRWLQANFPGARVKFVEPGGIKKGRLEREAAAQTAKRRGEIEREISEIDAELEALRGRSAAGAVHVLLKRREALQAQLE